jgi:hypothetical protein
MKTKLKNKPLLSVVGDSVWGSVCDSVQSSFWWTVNDYAGESVGSFVYDSVKDSVVNSVKRKCLEKLQTSNENKT